MKQNFKKLLSCAMALVMVASSITVTNTMAKGDELTTAQMVASASYNLAKGKVITANPSRQEGSEEALSDGDLTSNHAATTFGTAGTYYEIDLGAAYDASTIDQIVVQYKEYNTGDIPTKGYKIQYSTDSVNFTDVKVVSATDFASQVTDKDNLLEIQDVSDATGGVRYIRLFYPDSYSYGIQAREIAVLDTDLNAQTIQIEKCDDAAAITVESTDYNTITYSITAGENQEDYVYMVYLNETTKIGHAVLAGQEYTVGGIIAGAHTIKVIAVYNGKMSEGIDSDPILVSDISSLITSSKNISNKNNNPLASVVEVSAFYEGHTLTTAQIALDGKKDTGEGSNVSLRTASGSSKYIVVDLGDYYTPSEMDRLLLAYTNASTYAATTKVEFSLDNISYTVVGNSTGYQYSTGTPVNSVIFDSIDDYTEKAVRYVKITLLDGVSNWGYVVNEISIVANTDAPTTVGSNIPEAAGVTVDVSKLETVKYTITASEEQEDATYIVKLGDEIVNAAAKADTEYVIKNVAAGTYALKVCTLEDGWQSKGITENVTVDGYVNYIISSLNLAYRNAHPNVTATADNDNYGDNYLTGSQDISAGVGALNNGSYTDHAHHTGYLQSRPDNDEITIDYDLGQDYAPTDIHSIIALYENTAHAATEYEVLFSGDGEEFEQVLYIKDAKFETFANNAMLNDVVDVSEYTQETVRYVKYHIITGNYGRHYNGDGSINWGSSGYHLCELAVMGEDSILPDKVSGLVVTSPEFNKLVINWEDVKDQDVVYRVYLNGSPLGNDIVPGVQTAEFTIGAGSYVVQVATVKGELIVISGEVSVKVETETTTPKPTTPKPTTPAPTTPKPTTPSHVTQNPTVAPTQQAPTVAVEEEPIAITKIKKAQVGKKRVTLKLKKISGAKGYEIQYSLKKKMKKVTTITANKVKIVIKKLKKGKKYYFKARAYKEVNGVKVYGEWSKVKVSKKVK